MLSVLTDKIKDCFGQKQRRVSFLPGFGFGSVRPIGLDIGSSSIKMVQLRVDGVEVSVIAAEKVEMEPGLEDEQQKNEFVISSIKKMLDRGSFHGRNIISSLPSDKLKMTSLRLSELDMDRITETLKREAAQRFEMESDDDQIDYIVAGDIAEGSEVKKELIMLAVDSETIASHIDLIEQSQLSLSAIDIICGAMYRTLVFANGLESDLDSSYMFVDVGNEQTTVVIGNGQEISFVKQLPIGGANFNEEIAEKLGIAADEAMMLRRRLARTRKNGEQASEHLEIDPATRQLIIDATNRVADRLVKEISLCYKYYTVTFRGRRIKKGFFAGGTAGEELLINALNRQLAIDVEVAQPFKGVELSGTSLASKQENGLSEWTVAVGLCLKGIQVTA